MRPAIPAHVTGIDVNSSASSAATCNANRVLPTPPTPINVTNRRSLNILTRLPDRILAVLGRSDRLGTPVDMHRLGYDGV